MDASKVPKKPERRWRLRVEMDGPDGIVVVATGLDGEIVGLATAGPTRDEDALTPWELYSINVVAERRGTGVADQLITAVLGERPTTLWSARENGRAHTFYRRHGFTMQGGTTHDQRSDAPEIRMIRGRQSPQL
ncbi:MAG: GNAT family N-acetyltransferase [Dermatophilaceae bacterium]